jgi:hypothetical protein
MSLADIQGIMNNNVLKGALCTLSSSMMALYVLMAFHGIE